MQQLCFSQAGPPSSGDETWNFRSGVFALAQNVKKYPQLAEIAARVPKNTVLSKEAFLKHLEELDKSLRSVPATAQVTSSLKLLP